ncbi:MAG: PEPxxWA-CTERM sorting domain-containing protein [Sphingomonadaceae bacterium]
MLEVMRNRTRGPVAALACLVCVPLLLPQAAIACTTTVRFDGPGFANDFHVIYKHNGFGLRNIEDIPLPKDSKGLVWQLALNAFVPDDPSLAQHEWWTQGKPGITAGQTLCFDKGNYQLGARNFWGTIVDAYWTQNGTRLSVAPVFVPEPASWALFVAGFGLTGFAMRRRHARSQRQAPARADAFPAIPLRGSRGACGSGG